MHISLKFQRHLELECYPQIDSVVLTMRNTIIIPDETRARLVG